jgi:dihydropteroate synthase
MLAPSSKAPAVRLLGSGSGPHGPWASLRIAAGGAGDIGVWRREAEKVAPQVSLEPSGLETLASGPVAELEALGRALAAAIGASELRLAARGLSRPPRQLRLGAHRWRFGRRTYLLGVVNVTPDSFSGDGVGASPAAALALALELVAEGADALDVGGESSRPGHAPVPAAEELRRVLPAIEVISAAAGVPVFVDTAKAEVARAALAAGAVAVNDIWGLRGDPQMAGVVAAAGAAVVCMHNQVGTAYADLRGEVLQGLTESLRVAAQGGIPAAQVVLDPGFGFGKTPRQSLELLAHLKELRTLAQPLLVGTSRKSLVGWMLGNRAVEGRLFGTAATVAWAAAGGADVVRVHDVAEMRDIVKVVDQLVRSERG